MRILEEDKATKVRSEIIRTREGYLCSACDDNDGEIFYFCDPRVGRNCFKLHVEEEHL